MNLKNKFTSKSSLVPIGSQEARIRNDRQAVFQVVRDLVQAQFARGDEELTAYSFRHRYAYCGHNRPKADGSYRAPKQIADAMGHTLDTDLLNYSSSKRKILLVH